MTHLHEIHGAQIRAYDEHVYVHGKMSGCNIILGKYAQIVFATNHCHLDGCRIVLMDPSDIPVLAQTSRGNHSITNNVIQGAHRPFPGAFGHPPVDIQRLLRLDVIESLLREKVLRKNSSG